MFEAENGQTLIITPAQVYTHPLASSFSPKYTVALFTTLSTLYKNRVYKNINLRFAENLRTF